MPLARRSVVAEFGQFQVLDRHVDVAVQPDVMPSGSVVVRHAVERVGAAVDRDGLVNFEFERLRRFVRERHMVVGDEVDRVAILGGENGRAEAIVGSFADHRDWRDPGLERDGVARPAGLQVLAVGERARGVDRIGKDRVGGEFLRERDGHRRFAVGVVDVSAVGDVDALEHAAVLLGREFPLERLGDAAFKVGRFHGHAIGRGRSADRFRNHGVVGADVAVVDAHGDVRRLRSAVGNGGNGEFARHVENLDAVAWRQRRFGIHVSVCVGEPIRSYGFRNEIGDFDLAETEGRGLDAENEIVDGEERVVEIHRDVAARHAGIRRRRITGVVAVVWIVRIGIELQNAVGVDLGDEHEFFQRHVARSADEIVDLARAAERDGPDFAGQRVGRACVCHGPTRRLAAANVHLFAVHENRHGRAGSLVVHDDLDVVPGVIIDFDVSVQFIPRGSAFIARCTGVEAEDRIGRVAGAVGTVVDLVFEVDRGLDAIRLARGIEIGLIRLGVGTDEENVGVHERDDLDGGVGRRPREVVALRVELEVHARAGGVFEHVRHHGIGDVGLVAVDHRPVAGGVGGLVVEAAAEVDVGVRERTDDAVHERHAARGLAQFVEPFGRGPGHGIVFEIHLPPLDVGLDRSREGCGQNPSERQKGGCSEDSHLVVSFLGWLCAGRRAGRREASSGGCPVGSV